VWQRLETSRGPEFARRLLIWFRVHGRNLPWRTETSPYRILITEKFLMQTDPGHVLKIYDTFFRMFPTVSSLATAPESKIARVLRPIGFWRQRARHLKLMATTIVEDYDRSIPRSRRNLLEIYGIGQYTADAYLCFALGERRVAVDINSRRVAHRLFAWPSAIPNDRELARQLTKLIPRGKARDFNWAIIDFANVVCRRKPKCSVCFATDLCKFYRQLVLKT
jgi:A/G-specific adenine glycosylase